MPERTRIIQIGLGALGRMLTPYLIERPALEIVGAVDLDPSLIGRDLGDVAALGRKLGVSVCGDLSEPFAGGPVHAALLTTVSDLARARPRSKPSSRTGPTSSRAARSSRSHGRPLPRPAPR